MTKVRILFVSALMAISSLACAQETMKKGDKSWTDLEKQLADINDQWVCAHKYHKDHAMDCVDFKNNIWPETFFEVGRQGQVEDETGNGQEADSHRPSSSGFARRCRPESAGLQVNGSVWRRGAGDGSHRFQSRGREWKDWRHGRSECSAHVCEAERQVGACRGSVGACREVSSSFESPLAVVQKFHVSPTSFIEYASAPKTIWGGRLGGSPKIEKDIVNP